jgi:phosphatidylserine/phosphatidylglycerophosphate/cardiolipin synthase-like enzyme
MTRASLRRVSTRELQELLGELSGSTFHKGISKARLAAVHLEHLWERVSDLAPLGPAALRAVTEAVLSEREERCRDDVRLVWTGPEGKAGWAQPTSSTLEDLFRRAERDVLIAGYTFDHGGDLLAALHVAMQARGVAVEIFLHMDRASSEADIPRHVRSNAAEFFAQNWPFGPPHPRLYVARDTLLPRARGNLHAKCVVVDAHWALVGSANFTQRGQERNIEVGLWVESEALGRQLVAQFHGAASAGAFVAVEELYERLVDKPAPTSPTEAVLDPILDHQGTPKLE